MAVLELCLAWVCVHPLLVAQQAGGGGGHAHLAARGAWSGFPGAVGWPRGGQSSGFGAEHSWVCVLALCIVHVLQGSHTGRSQNPRSHFLEQWTEQVFVLQYKQ